jgi:hypothetical protein
MKFVSTRLVGASVLLAALLAGCGGGGGNDTTTTTGGTTTGGTTTGGTTTGGTTVEASAKYIGNWAASCNSLNESETFEITRASATSVNFSYVLSIFPSAGCTGTPVIEDGSGTATIVGQASDGFDNVDVVESGTPRKWAVNVTSAGNLVIDFEDDNNEGLGPTHPSDRTDGTGQYTK